MLRPTSSDRRNPPANPRSRIARLRTECGSSPSPTQIVMMSVVRKAAAPTCLAPCLRRIPSGARRIAGCFASKARFLARCAAAIAARCRSAVLGRRGCRRRPPNSTSCVKYNLTCSGSAGRAGKACRSANASQLFQSERYALMVFPAIAARSSVDAVVLSWSTAAVGNDPCSDRSASFLVAAFREADQRHLQCSRLRCRATTELQSVKKPRGDRNAQRVFR